MNPDFNRLLASPAEDRLGLFLATANRLGTTVQNIEKDFWVCWTLDALFNGLEPGGPHLFFKGGTSLSKGFGLIERFSEDIDITVLRADIDAPATVAELEALSGKKRQQRLDDIRVACQRFIGGDLRAQLQALAASVPLHDGQLRVTLDEDDRDGQTLLVHYPAAAGADPYLRPAVKIEAGAKSALDPHRACTIVPYAAGDLENFTLDVSNVMTVDPVRTFWDKVLILHSLRRSFEDNGTLRGGGQRVSRHYYDVAKILPAELGQRAAADFEMAHDCVRHERMFFRRAGQDTAVPGSFQIVPSDGMLALLRRDYAAMAGMIFGTVPDFDAIIADITRLETQLNQVPVDSDTRRWAVKRSALCRTISP